ncbi:MAG: hypothetical protein LBT91_03480 [Bifidobacteriaceae bacterium]|jgi:hypothetical protein|nr:hypothetical protein [Bifidobacteriaceae bacterium]
MVIKKRLNRISFYAVIFLLGFVSFMSGFILTANAANNTTYLPITRGGTGAGTVPDAQTNLGKITSITSSATESQFPSAKAVYDFVNECIENAGCQ